MIKNNLYLFEFNLKINTNTNHIYYKINKIRYKLLLTVIYSGIFKIKNTYVYYIRIYVYILYKNYDW